MTQPEFLAWIEFYKQNPFDDRARYYRPAALIAHKLTGETIDDCMSWLAREKSAAEQAAERYSSADLTTMKAFGMKPPKRSTETGT